MSESQEGKKFGTIGGVFLPSLLTILGVIMYLRMGWVVGQAGIIGTILVILLAHVISVTTGLSVSSIATDKKIKAGGIYYMLSRSLGLPIGGSIGLTLFVGTGLSISLYLIGFAESFNATWNFGSTLNDYRLTGTAALFTLTIIALISTNLAVKAQYFILGAIALSLVSIFAGMDSSTAPPQLFFEGTDIEFGTVFAIFFPAVTGFTAGIALSGDLENPKKSIPLGTMLAIGTGFVVYIALAFYIIYNIHPTILRTNNNILVTSAWIPGLVIAGIWGATLSSALGGVLGAPRIMQAIAKDKIASKKLAEGVGPSNEPRNALILTFIIAQAGILIGELDAIAGIVTMFYLSAYGFINLSAALENWSSSEFRPTFRIPTWISIIGFLATFFIMVQLDPLAMIVSFLLLGGVFFYLRRKQMAVGSGSIWMNVWRSLVRAGLKLIDVESVHKRNWEPNILAVSVENSDLKEIRTLGQDIAGQYGMATQIDLQIKPELPTLFSDKAGREEDPNAENTGIFIRSLKARDPYDAIDSLATTFGFPGVEPNTVLVSLSALSSDPEKGNNLVQHIMDLDHNFLLLDTSNHKPFGNKQKIDIWWRGLSNNGELMLQLTKFLTASEDWRQADFRLIMIGTASKRKKRRYDAQREMIKNVLNHFRLNGEILLLDNTEPPKEISELISETSSEADLVILGLPTPQQVEKVGFIPFVNGLTEKIHASVLLVRASSYFQTREIDIEEKLDEQVIKVEE